MMMVKMLVVALQIQRNMVIASHLQTLMTAIISFLQFFIQFSSQQKKNDYKIHSFVIIVSIVCHKIIEIN